MFQDDGLKNHLETTSVIKSNALVVAEWNMNLPENIVKVGNYRYHPAENILIPNQDNRSKYSFLYSGYDPNDEGNYYTDATFADIVIDGGISQDGTPEFIRTKKQKEQLLYSLEDCFGRFRPRSGINKARWFGSGTYIHNSNPDMASRPRYYVSSKNDYFKYWSSFREEAVDANNDGIYESNTVRGISNIIANDQYYIDDAVPFVVYKDPVPTNRIVVKTQTNVGTVRKGNLDPFFGDDNKTTPVTWKIQYLENNSWSDAITFDENSFRDNGLPIVGPDGYLEISYGLIVPEEYRSIFVPAESYSSVLQLPSESINGYAYLVGATNSTLGVYYIWSQEDEEYKTFTPNYGWSVHEETVSDRTNYVKTLTNPPTYSSGQYREFKYVQGLRIVVETMNKLNSLFDLIELSPRLVADISGITSSYDITKNASDLGVSGMPVGQLLASTGSLRLFDYDNSFITTNSQSIISKYINQYTQIKFFDVIKEVVLENGIFNYFVPIKTMYVDGFPEITASDRTVSITLRDLYFNFETTTAPQILITNVSLSFAVSTLLDSVGFSNYSFKRIAGEPDPMIPLFFIPPDTSVAVILEDLAVSTQHTMFFDEYNNLIVMSKEYMMPTSEQRLVDMELIGNPDSSKVGIVENAKSSAKLANIIDVISTTNNVYNDGAISYSNRHIARHYADYNTVSKLNRNKTWVYKVSELWELGANDEIRSTNNSTSSQGSYALTAVPLSSNLSDTIPTVSNHRIINNEIDLGESANLIARYFGYLYANGEVIKYDAVQYNIPGLSIAEDPTNSGNVWITNETEYQDYIGKLPFNGKIYPTGLVRIYSEPNYETESGITRLKNGPVSKHGRGQFGTPVVSHYAGLNSYWSDDSNVRGVTMESKYLFGSSIFAGALNKTEKAGKDGAAPDRDSDSVARRSQRNGILKNFLGSTDLQEIDFNRMQVPDHATTQSSALIFSGPNYFSDEKAIDGLSYVYKPLSDKFTHFGTRMRIVGRQEVDTIQSQTPVGVNTYYSTVNATSDKNISIGGSSGGIAVMLNPETNVGYYFELASLTDSNISSYEDADISDVLFYKVLSSTQNKTAIPVKLWSDYVGINVDDGYFSGQARAAGEKVQTVYDLSIEYEDIGDTRRFYLYINNSLIQVVDDIDPLPIRNNMALFIRGEARCMFENVYAITNNYAQNTTSELNLPAASAFGFASATTDDAFRKYAVSGMIQSTYLSGISSMESPKHQMYFEEFGTIMREAAYFKVRYDKAYPALAARIADTNNPIKGYSVSGFIPGSYGAEFLIFNNTDTLLELDSNQGNFIIIHGVAFTQDSTNEFKMDDYFGKVGTLSDPQFIGAEEVVSPIAIQEKYKDIKLSRLKYGNQQFSLSTTYLQTLDDAIKLMSWLVERLSKPRLSVGLRIFSNPMIQLGDIVSINYKVDGVDQVAAPTSKFVVYQIEYSRGSDGPETTLYLSEVST
jgi:hypothetical protein